MGGQRKTVSAGSCCTKDALVQTDRGVLHVEEIFQSCGLIASTRSCVTNIEEENIKILDGVGEYIPITHLVHSNKKPLVEIHTESGKKVKLTQRRMVRVLRADGFFSWKAANALLPGDIVVTSLQENKLSSYNNLKKEEALLLGYLIGDGHYSNPQVIDFAQKDEEVLNEFVNIANQIFPTAVPKIIPGIRVRYANVAFNKHVVETYGLTRVKSGDKYVPEIVRNAPLDAQAAFLAAYYECDGGVEGHNVNVTTASYTLAVDIYNMLATFGLHASIREKKIKTYPDNTYYTISLAAHSSILFLEKIGFRSARRRVQCKALLAKKAEDTLDEIRSVPNQINIMTALIDDIGGDRQSDRIVGDLERTSRGPGRNQISCSLNRITTLLDWVNQKQCGEHYLAAHFKNLVNQKHGYETVVATTLVDNEATFDLLTKNDKGWAVNGIISRNNF